MGIQCRQFQPNIFNKTRCKQCFRDKEAHTEEALENNKASRKITNCGYLYIAPDNIDFADPSQRNRRWQRRWFCLFDDGELTWALDESPDTLPQGKMDMTICVEIASADVVTTKDHSIKLKTATRSEYVRADGADQMKRWRESFAPYSKQLTNRRSPRRSTMVIDLKGDALPAVTTVTTDPVLAEARKLREKRRESSGAEFSSMLDKIQPTQPPQQSPASSVSPSRRLNRPRSGYFGNDVVSSRDTTNASGVRDTWKRNSYTGSSEAGSPKSNVDEAKQVGTKGSENSDINKPGEMSRTGRPSSFRKGTEGSGKFTRGPSGVPLKPSELVDRQKNQPVGTVVGVVKPCLRRSSVCTDTLTAAKMENSVEPAEKPVLRPVSTAGKRPVSIAGSSGIRSTDSLPKRNNSWREKSSFKDLAKELVIDLESSAKGEPTTSIASVANKETDASMWNQRKGWLSMKSEQAEWTKYWVVLDTISLKLFKDAWTEDVGKAAEVIIDLSTCESINPNSLARNYGIEIKCKTSRFAFSALTPGIRDSWIRAIHQNVSCSTNNVQTSIKEIKNDGTKSKSSSPELTSNSSAEKPPTSSSNAGKPPSQTTSKRHMSLSPLRPSVTDMVKERSVERKADLRGSRRKHNRSVDISAVEAKFDEVMYWDLKTLKTGCFLETQSSGNMTETETRGVNLSPS